MRGALPHLLMKSLYRFISEYGIGGVGWVGVTIEW